MTTRRFYKDGPCNFWKKKGTSSTTLMVIYILIFFSQKYFSIILKTNTNNVKLAYH